MNDKLRLLVYGECHAKIICEESFKQVIFKDFDLINILYGDGKIDRFLNILEVFNFQDNDIFLIGGSAQESPIELESFNLKLRKVFNTIFTKYKNSKIIFWNVTTKPQHPTYEKIIEFNKLKTQLANNNNIFSININLLPEDFSDNVHFSPSGRQKFIEQIENFLKINKQALKKPRFELLIGSQQMSFEQNEAVIFILQYKQKIPAEIRVEYHDQKKSVFKHHYGTNVTPDRMNILKLKNVKKISFGNNIVPVKCQVQAY